MTVYSSIQNMIISMQRIKFVQISSSLYCRTQISEQSIV